MRIQDRLFASLGCCCQGWPDQREGQNNPGRNRPSGHALICRPPGEEQPWKVGPLPSRMRPRAISPFPIGGSFGLPASGPPRQSSADSPQPTALSHARHRREEDDWFTANAVPFPASSPAIIRSCVLLGSFIDRGSPSSHRWNQPVLSHQYSCSGNGAIFGPRADG
jgi:hypothetical protein